MSADTVWPPALTRAPRVADLEETAPDVVLRSEMDVGPAKLRRRFTGDKRKFSIVLDLRASEVATFDAFFKDTTFGGSLSFSWVLPRTGFPADFRFTSTPVYRPQGPRGDGSEWWRVTFSVEMLPGTDSAIVPPAPGSNLFGGGNFFAWVSKVEDEVVPLPDEESIFDSFWKETIAAQPDVFPDLFFSGFGDRSLDAEVLPLVPVLPEAKATPRHRQLPYTHIIGFEPPPLS